MNPKGILFDFDGVVVDSFESHYSAWKSAFKELFNEEIVPFPKSYAGKSPMIIAGYFCSVIGKENQTEELFLLKDKHLDIYFKTPKLLPGVHEIVSFLSDKKIPYGIASNATKQFLKNSIYHLNLNFTTVFGVQDYEKPKPYPEAYITLAKALGFTKNDFKNIWVFEDSLTGTKAAKLAGMIPIGILTQYSEAELKEAGSILTFPTLLEAYNFLNNN
ncbi:HAD family phosphatase [uncultured Polaribacter sp.]|uniref:HAD family hydrolase n=1 Tax=uncultured Polaribacter sp. TaxID=174711 RepID=UPI002608513A|nr:HAD family phosphatase [uncultured Polaribacter sp.]